MEPCIVDLQEMIKEGTTEKCELTHHPWQRLHDVVKASPSNPI